MASFSVAPSIPFGSFVDLKTIDLRRRLMRPAHSSVFNGERERSLGASIYDVRKMFRFFDPYPLPLCRIQIYATSFPFVFFFGYPLPLECGLHIWKLPFSAAKDRAKKLCEPRIRQIGRRRKEGRREEKREERQALARSVLS